MAIQSIARTLEHAETRYLNRAGYIPGLSTLSGAGRALLSLAEVISGIAMLAFSPRMGASIAYHGLANTARAVIEIIPLINLIAYLYDNRMAARTFLGFSLPTFPIQ